MSAIPNGLWGSSHVLLFLELNLQQSTGAGCHPFPGPPGPAGPAFPASGRGPLAAGR